jgi:MFS family permease
VSISGTRISTIALAWFVLTTTGSATKTGLVALFEMAPLIVAKALGGPVIDRVGPRRISIASDTASVVVMAAIPLLHTGGLLTFPVLLGLVMVAGALRGPGDTAKETMVPDIAEASGATVERVAGLGGSTDRLAMVVGPALAGVLIASVGTVNALYVDALSFAVAAGLIARFVPVRRAPVPDGAALASAEASYLDSLRAGWRYLLGDRLVLAISLVVAVTNFLDAAYSAVLLPVWIRNHGYGPAELGLVGSCTGLFATVASLLAAVYGHRLPRRTVFVVGFLLAGAPRFFGLASGLPLGAFLGVAAVSGLGAGFLNPIISAVYVQRVPRALLGRVGAMSDAVAWAGIPFGGVLAGAGIAAIGLAPVLALAGGVYLLTTSLPFRAAGWRDLDERDTSTSSTGKDARDIVRT